MTAVRCPIQVRRGWLRLSGRNILSRDVRKNKILRSDRNTMQPAQHRKLSGVRHRIGKRTLEELFVTDSSAE